MKRISHYIITVLLTALMANTTIGGQGLDLQDRQLSILGNDKETIMSSFDTGTSSAPAAPDAPSATEAASPAQLQATAPSTSPSPLPSPEMETSDGTVIGSPLSLSELPEETSAGKAGDELNDFLSDPDMYRYSKDRWIKMRDDVENGRTPGGEETQDAVVRSTEAKPAAPALPPGLAVDLPYESQLSISGRKLIGVSMKSTMYDKQDETHKNSSSFDMSQELQVRIKGRVGKKINVNVDFDDTRDDKRDISVVYKGDPDEFVQEAAFGDIAMSLPSTEFVGYSRQLFGVKMDTKYKKLRTQGFFSRTKGLSEAKRFSGNTKFERRTIPDTSYIPMKYYSLRSGYDAIKAGTVKVYRDDGINTNNSQIVVSTATALESLTTPTSTYTGNFDLLVAGQDYTVDYHTGILSFKNKLANDAVVAIDYQKNDGSYVSSGGATPGNPKIIKDRNNTPVITTELKTFYSLGNVKIIRDNGRGNFILKVQDLNDAAPSTLQPGDKAVPAYPTNINVDFENGVFNFVPADAQPFPDDLYTANTHRYNILTEYRYRIKIINLRPGIVPQSERVVMDGKVLKADDDYFIDYDAGIVTLYNEDRINENTVIDVSYDYSPFGGTGGSTLIGMRSELSLTNNIFVGGTFIYDFAAKSQTVPDIRTAPSSLRVGEVDSRIQNVKIPYTPLSMSMSGEYAMSENNPNTMNKAIVESMEGIKQEDAASLYYDSWNYASNPTAPPPNNYYAGDLSWGSQEILKRDIDPKLEVERDEKQQVLNVSYNLANSRQVSLLQNLSTSGYDYTHKLYLETWIKGDNQGEDLSIAYGSFNEDVDGDGRLDTEDTNGDGTLSNGEDTGYEYNLLGTVTRVGAGNGKIDTEDLNANGLLDGFDTTAFPGPYGPGDGRTLVDADGVSHSKVDWTGWKFFRIPLNITQADDWKNIRQIRLTIKGSSAQRGQLSFAGIAVVGNRWEADGNSVSGSSVTVAAVNSENTGYVPLTFNKQYQDLYDQQDIDSNTKSREQALSLNYDIQSSTGGEATAKLVYNGRPYDLSQYGSLRFFVYAKDVKEGDVFYVQAGGNDSNYFEYSMPVPPEWVGSNRGWNLVTIRQVGSSSRADHWLTDDPRGSTRIVGAPSLQNVSQMKVGVRTNSPSKGELWLNEIHVTDPLKKEGRAWKANLDFNWPGSGRVGGANFGASRKSIDRNFETFSAGVYNRDYLEDSGYLSFKGVNLGGVSVLPFNSRITRTRTVTPSVVQNQNDLLSVLDEGRVTTYTGSFDTALNLGKYFPQLTGQYTRGISDSQKIQRLEDRETLSGTLQYNLPVRFNLLPTSISGNASVTNSYFRVYPSTRIMDTDTFLDLNAADLYRKVTDYHTLEVSRTWGVKAPFQPWSGFNLTPSYNLNTVDEENKDLPSEHDKYPKSLNQDVGASGSLRVFPWLVPNFNYAMNVKESYNLNYSTTSATPTFPSEKKFIERNATGEVTWNLQMRDLLRNRYLQSLGFTSSYRIQDSDSYENMRADFNPLGASLDKLWLRGNQLKDPLAQGTTSYQMKSLVEKDDIRVAGKYNPFEAMDFRGKLEPLRTLSANFTYTGNKEYSNTTGTERKVFTKIWPDVIFGLSRWERMVSLDPWVSDSQITVRHQKKTVETMNISQSESKSYGTDLRFKLMGKLDLNVTLNNSHSEEHDTSKNQLTSQGESLTWSTQGGFNVKNWRFTLRYEDGQDWAKDGAGKLTSQLFTKAFTAQVYSDMSFPRGLPIPFTRRTLPLTNRLIFNSAFKYVIHDSNLNIERDRNVNYGLTASAEYEVSQNFRLSLGFGYNRFEYKENPKENYSSLEASSRLTIQF